MTYENIIPARFLDRPNRFIANIEIDGRQEVCHVKNTGRCRELLIPGAEIYVQRFDSASRKTKYDLITVRKGERFINIDSQAPNKVFYEFASSGGFISGIEHIRPETRFGSSRFDFCMDAAGRKIIAEIKGVTLEKDGAALFPDAPTERGVKHLRELISCTEEGCSAWVIFIIQMSGIKYFTPNRVTHPEFADVLSDAASRGVNIAAYGCRVTKDSLVIDTPVPIKL